MSQPETLWVAVEAILTLDPDRPKNSLHMAFSDCEAQIFDGEERLGEVTGCLGGAVEIGLRTPDGRRLIYTLRPMDLLKAARAAYAAAHAEEMEA